MRRPAITSFAAGAVFALVVGSGTAVAATGGKLILGRSNAASGTTTLTSSTGPALSLKSKSGGAPLAVGSKRRVANLNADTVDGVDSSAIARTAGRTGAVDAVGTLVDSDTSDSYDNDTIVAYAECPAGTQATGGGFEDYTSSGYVVASRAVTGAPEAWAVVVGFDPSVTESGDDVVASAVCYSPKGAVHDQPASVTTSGSDARAALTPQVRRALVAKAAAR